MDKRISVLIITYNRKHMLPIVIQCLAEQTLPREYYELILVDDGSTDGTPEVVESLRSSMPYDISFVRREHLGLSSGRNEGIRRARGEYVLFIDDDVLADPRLLEEHLRYQEKHPGRIVVNGWVNHITVPCKPNKPRLTIQDISTSFFWTSNVSVKREYLLEAGLFDESFKEYGWEDQEIGFRLMRLGLKAHFHYKAIAFHYKRPITVEDLPRLVAQAQAKGRTAVIYFRKHPVVRVALATGIHPLGLGLYHLLAFRGILKRFCERRLARAKNRPLSGLDLWCAHQILGLTYYDTICENFSGSSAGKESGVNSQKTGVTRKESGASTGSNQ